MTPWIRRLFGALLFAVLTLGLGTAAQAELYVSTFLGGFGFGSLDRYDIASGAFLNSYTDANLAFAAGVARGPDGNLYVSSAGTGQVLKFDVATKTFSFFALPLDGNSDPQSPGVLRWGADGNLYVTQQLGANIFVFNGAGTQINTIPDAVFVAGGVNFLPGGDMLVGDFITGDIVRVQNPASGSYSASPFASLGSGSIPAGLLVHDDTVYATDYVGNRIAKFDLGGVPQGSILLPAEPPFEPGDVAYLPTNSPFGMTPDLDGTGFYVATGGPTQTRPLGLVLHYAWDGTPLVGVDGIFISGIPVASDVAAVPEPSTWFLGLAGIGMLGFARRFRRKRPSI